MRYVFYREGNGILKGGERGRGRRGNNYVGAFEI